MGKIKKKGKKKKSTKEGTGGASAGEASSLCIQVPSRTVLPVLQTPSPQTQSVLFAVTRGEVQSVQRLVSSYGCRSVLPTTDTNGSNALHVAVRKGKIEMVKQLLTYPQISIDALENEVVGGYSALHIACKENNPNIVKVLVDAGANVNAKTSSALSETPLHICCKNGATECARLLISAGANTDARDGFGHNPTFWANSKQFGSMTRDLALPPIHSATAEEHLALMKLRNPMFSLTPAAKPKKKKKGDKKKK